MKVHLPLTQAEKERIFAGKLAGRTLAELANEVGCTLSCARKWWRCGRNEGRRGLQMLPRGRPRCGMLSHFDERVRKKALAHKQQRRRWGADRILVELRRDPELAGLRLPSRSRLASFFKVHCPECVARHRPTPPRRSQAPPAREVHVCWQVDTQEGIRLQNDDIISICNIRDPFGAAMIASLAWSVKKTTHWRKLSLAEVQTTLRAGFSEWKTLPDAVQTDNELVLTGSPTDPFPSQLTLWLSGLDVRHRFIRPHTPTDQPQVERNHRTLDGFALNEVDLVDLANVQQALDRERALYHSDFPSHASDCHGRPPLIAHPELLTPRRFYQPERELALFSISRVYDFLATFTFVRKVNASGQVSLGNHLYSIGREHAGKTVLVHLHADSQHWTFHQLPADADVSDLPTNQELLLLARRPLKHITGQTLTGLAAAAPDQGQEQQPFQPTSPAHPDHAGGTTLLDC